MNSRKIALSLARQYRTCPSADIRNRPEHRERVRRHRQLCPYCMHGEDAWEALLAGRPRFTGENPSLTEMAAPGQIREILPESGQWKNGFYYYPPLILILDVHQETAVAAQVYHDATLAGPDDVILPDLTGAPLPLEFFAELWNCYDIRLQMIGNRVFRLPAEIFQDICGLRSEGRKPTWYRTPRPMTANDPRIFFREIEQEVGQVFALAHRKPLMERLKEITTVFGPLSVTGIIDMITGAAPDVTWPREPRSILQALSQAVVSPKAPFPGKQTETGESAQQWRFFGEALSFSGNAISPAPEARLYTYVSGKLVDIRCFPVSLYQIEFIDGLAALGGQIHQLPEDIRESDVYAFLQAAQRWTDAREIHLDMDSGSFLAKFDNPDFRNGTLIFLILRTSE